MDGTWGLGLLLHWLIGSGGILYLLLAALLVLFVLKGRPFVLDRLLERDARKHHHVQAVIGKHPRGGAWREHRRWMTEET